jgi:phosphatidylinositol alpha-1,6-mannosyltransferase
MKALFVCTDFPPATGGIQTMLSSLVAELAGWEVTVVAPAIPGAAAFDVDKPYQVVRVPGIGPGAGARRYIPGLCMKAMAQAFTRRPDMLFCGHPVLCPLGPLLRRTLGTRYVVFTYAMELRNPRLRPLLPRILSRSEKVVTISEFTTREVLQLGVPRPRIVQLPLGFDVRRFEGIQPCQLPRQLGLVGNPWLLTVSRLEKRYKGIDTVLRALPLIAERVPDVRYVVAGDGRLRPDLERLAEQVGCRDRVHFLGRVSSADLVALYSGCTAFVLMSRDRTADGGAEGFGLVFLEANSFGKPVLGGNSGGIPDAVLDGVTGLLADPESLPSVAEQAVRLLTDRDLAERLGRQGRERVLRDLTWSATADCLRRAVEESSRRVSYATPSDCVH